MRRLQATWAANNSLFFWAHSTGVRRAVEEELPELTELLGEQSECTILSAGTPVRRKRVKGFLVPVRKVLPILPALRYDPSLSDSLRCWSMASRLGLELAARQAVAPRVESGVARWQALWTRHVDRQRFDEVVESLPVSARLMPTRPRGSVRLHSSRVVVRDFINAIVDGLYRGGGYPGSARGWALEFADALRGENPSFSPRDARCHGVPAKLAAWAGVDGAVGLHLGVELSLPEEGSDRFGVSFWMYAPDHPGDRVDVKTAWQSGEHVELGGRTYRHPAYSVIQAFARAKRIFPLFGGALAGSRPKNLSLSAKQAWRFLSEGVAPLRDAGFDVQLPEAFSTEGSRRIRARMRVEADPHAENVRLDDMLTYRWEVTLGDLVLSGADFAEITALGEPIVRFRGEWVLLDPRELEKLPKGLPQEGTLDAAAALRAVLTGQHDRVPVVADDRLSMVIDALRQPPDVDVPDELDASLRPYQEKGLSWLSTLGNLGLGACLADDMGLGKTIQVIAHILRRDASGRRRYPSLVVCPTSVLGNWTHELARFAPSLSVARHHGLHRSLEKSRESDVVITTYGLLARDVDELSAAPWDVVALDEAQAIKNPDSQRARAAVQLTARHRVAMSGTPVENRLEELWSLMRFLVPGLLGARAQFRRNVAIPVERFGDEDVAKRLRLGVSPFLLRRLKSDPTIISDLPDKIEQLEYCTLTAEQAKLYRQTVEDFMERIAGAESMERRGMVLAMLTALKQICNHPDQYLKEGGRLAGRSGKLDRVRDILESVVDAGERVIVFTQYREMGDRLVQHLLEAMGFTVPFLHGGVPSERRDEMVRQFQEDDDVAPILLVSLRAGGTGLNLTRASHVIHYDRWWNPAVEDQATDRAYRIGQKNNVMVHKFVCQGTLEEKIDKLLTEKRALAESVVGGGERLVTELDDAALRALVALGDDAVLEDE